MHVLMYACIGYLFVKFKCFTYIYLKGPEHNLPILLLPVDLQSTPDNSNLLGKLKKGSSYQEKTGEY